MRNAYLGPDTQGAFDLVLIDNALERIQDLQPFLANAANLLAPRGNLLVAIAPFAWLRRMLGAVRVFLLTRPAAIRQGGLSFES